MPDTITQGSIGQQHFVVTAIGCVHNRHDACAATANDVDTDDAGEVIVGEQTDILVEVIGRVIIICI